MISLRTQASCKHFFTFPLSPLDLSALSGPTTAFHHVHNGMGGGYSPGVSPTTQQAVLTSPTTESETSEDMAVAQALEIARESPDGAQDPTVNNILEAALTQLWSKVQAQPDSYVLTRGEFAVFNYFQYRFVGNKAAVAARKRYWDHATGTAA